MGLIVARVLWIWFSWDDVFSQSVQFKIALQKTKCNHDMIIITATTLFVVLLVVILIHSFASCKLCSRFSAENKTYDIVIVHN